MRRKSFTRIIFISGIGLTIILAGCAKPESDANQNRPIRVEQPVTPEKLPAQPTPSASPQFVKLPPPTADQAREKVTAIFQGAVNMDASANPAFVSGDFNGDGIDDIAIVVVPSANSDAIMKINDELANWIRVEPQKIFVPKAIGDMRKFEKRTKPDPVEKGDKLLAVIHGFGPRGWQSPDARQTFLLQDIVGSGMKSESVKELAKALKSKDDLPVLKGQVIDHGDVISETLAGKPGLVFWTGATYSWRPNGATQ